MQFECSSGTLNQASITELNIPCTKYQRLDDFNQSQEECKHTDGRLFHKETTRNEEDGTDSVRTIWKVYTNYQITTFNTRLGILYDCVGHGHYAEVVRMSKLLRSAMDTTMKMKSDYSLLKDTLQKRYDDIKANIPPNPVVISVMNGTSETNSDQCPDCWRTDCGGGPWCTNAKLTRSRFETPCNWWTTIGKECHAGDKCKYLHAPESENTLAGNYLRLYKFVQVINPYSLIKTCDRKPTADMAADICTKSLDKCTIQHLWALAGCV